MRTWKSPNTILAPGETEAAGGRGRRSRWRCFHAGHGKNARSMMGGMMGGGGPGGAKTDAESVYYVKSGNDQQYRILPVQMTVLIDQDHVQDLLVELENSPMSIQVKDFELQRPTSTSGQARERNRAGEMDLVAAE